ncbi:hypothetical protein [Klenkia brasiliensis]|uniref:ABC transporter n=1 Tax=Klenkia brasiliensis TaxID=333142 RepID=A0A1G7PTB9_9ACTN|nr:hypothetical protein [Klenkia brasiliensis]SDF88640.1 hypothetical protein SAMN05660324_1182 [Klenkia brasiliensis]
MSLKLPVASVVVLLGPAPVRSAVCGALDEGSARCADGHGGLGAVRLTAPAHEPLADRLARVAAADAPVVLVQRLTDGLPAAQRRTLLSALRGLAAHGATVLVDDVDPVAALSVADTSLRAHADGRVELEPLPDVAALLAS